MMPDPIAVDVKTAAQMCGCSKDVIYAALRSTPPLIPHRRVGEKQTKYVIDVEGLRRWARGESPAGVPLTRLLGEDAA